MTKSVFAISNISHFWNVSLSASSKHVYVSGKKDRSVVRKLMCGSLIDKMVTQKRIL